MVAISAFFLLSVGTALVVDGEECEDKSAVATEHLGVASSPDSPADSPDSELGVPVDPSAEAPLKPAWWKRIPGAKAVAKGLKAVREDIRAYVQKSDIIQVGGHEVKKIVRAAMAEEMNEPRVTDRSEQRLIGYFPKDGLAFFPEQTIMGVIHPLDTMQKKVDYWKDEYFLAVYKPSKHWREQEDCVYHGEDGKPRARVYPDDVLVALLKALSEVELSPAAVSYLDFTGMLQALCEVAPYETALTDETELTQIVTFCHSE
jgi:hypothetical protein